ncbi:hypothetical protein [Dyella mobilis]|uniref:Uncharacterized protein n=1 Tax=Dyella mobilis TaxID=1849582 RepID=A0ABS2KCL3_9GAMM|nr:hypothetical protein [Dyella mobilis]MBM7128780.1 hypothetical protein [Dyella mobilis]GLQ99112.1 hypothetical protein GCM10007863_35320 [Dyella mobilis]
MKVLPERAHLEHLRKQAKTLLDGIRRGDPESLERIRTTLPSAARLDHHAIAAMPLRLHDAQSCLAREYGFDSWIQLKNYVELQAASADAATQKRQWRQRVFGHGYQPAKPQLAERLLRDHPGLTTHAQSVKRTQNRLRLFVVKTALPKWLWLITSRPFAR